MSDLGRKFMAAALGTDGAQALRKAAEREPQLDQVLIPRAIVGWLSFTTEHEYEGQIPGIENSYVQFHKAENGFNGSISLNEGVYSFEGASIYHLAASIAMALGVETGSLDASVRDAVLVKLGKSIDTLAKAQVLMQELKSPKALGVTRMTTHGAYHIAHNGTADRPYSVVHTKTGTVVQPGIASLRDAQPIAEWHNNRHANFGKVELPGQSHQPTAQQGPTAPMPPQKQPAGAKPKLPKVPKQPGLAVGKSEAEQACEACGGHQFENHKFRGCICFRDLAKNIKTTAYGDGYVLDFNSNIDADTVKALMKTFRSRNG